LEYDGYGKKEKKKTVPSPTPKLKRENGALDGICCIQSCSASSPFHSCPSMQTLLSVDFKEQRQWLIEKKRCKTYKK